MDIFEKMRAIRFTLLTSEEKEKISVLDVTTENELNSPLLGTVSNKRMCVTCGKYSTCAGHCGLIRLPHAIPNPMYEKVILNYINNYCHHCGAKLKHRKSKVECLLCHRITTADHKLEDGHYKNLSADAVTSILEKISPHLTSLMIDKVVVPPSRIRVTAPEYPHSTELSKMYVNLLRSKTKTYDNVKAIMGSQRHSGVYKLISGKEGLFRQNIFGKRVNRSGRTVVVGDSFLPVECVRLPPAIMDVLRPEIAVTFNNMNSVQEMAKNGLIRTRDDVAIAPHHVLPGNTFFRVCQEGDMVLINRQPSLSKYSIMSFKIVKGTSDVMMINPCITPAFNADFDGDEMNVFLLDDVQSRVEVREILSVEHNSECIQPVQDTITGSYMMSKDSSVYDDFDNYYMYVSTSFDHFKRCKQTRKSSGVLSLCFEEDFSLDVDGVVIRDGILEKGLLTKSNIMKIMHSMNDKCKFINSLQKVTSLWLMENGLSVSLTRYRKKCDFAVVDEADEDEMEQAIEHLRSVQTIDSEGHLKDIVDSGAKGQPMNIVQMCSYLGQQYISGDRPNLHGNRGFIKSSYIDGLNPTEYFIHQMAAREGVVNTGVSTSETGYLGRRATKIVSDVQTSYGGMTVENNQIISF
jgi:DNA-directed RNA polymerase beta' subunit